MTDMSCCMNNECNAKLLLIILKHVGTLIKAV